MVKFYNLRACHIVGFVYTGWSIEESPMGVRSEKL